MPPPRKWTDDQFTQAVRDSGSMREVAVRLGIWWGGPANETFRRRAAALGLTLPNGWYKTGGRHDQPR